MSLLNVSPETQDALLEIGSRDAQQDRADLLALLRAEVQPGDVVGRVVLSIIDRDAGLATIDEFQQWHREACAKFDQAVGEA